MSSAIPDQIPEAGGDTMPGAQDPVLGPNDVADGSSFPEETPENGGSGNDENAPDSVPGDGSAVPAQDPAPSDE